MYTNIARFVAALAIVAGVSATALPVFAASTALDSATKATTQSETKVETKTETAPSTRIKTLQAPIDTRMSTLTQIDDIRVTDVSLIYTLQSLIASHIYGAVLGEKVGHQCLAVTNVYPPRPCDATNISMSLYNIQITRDTKILDVNRKPITLDDVKVDHMINVYGRMNKDGTIEALVLRDLDVSAKDDTKVQLENLEVYSVEKGTSGSMKVMAGSNGGGTCFDFSTAGYKRPFPCPLNTSKATNEVIQMKRPTILYEINIPVTAQILDSKRAGIMNREIRVGDVINVYGTSKGDNKVTAEIVRIVRPAVNNEPLEIQAKKNVRGKVGKATSFALVAKGGTAPYTWQENSVAAPTNVITRYTKGLPPGMTLQTAVSVPACAVDTVCPVPLALEGQAWIVGTPTKAGAYEVNVLAMDASGRMGTATMRIKIAR